jgi:hypothetical protein
MNSKSLQENLDGVWEVISTLSENGVTEEYGNPSDQQ